MGHGGPRVPFRGQRHILASRSTQGNHVSSCAFRARADTGSPGSALVSRRRDPSPVLVSARGCGVNAWAAKRAEVRVSRLPVRHEDHRVAHICASQEHRSQENRSTPFCPGGRTSFGRTPYFSCRARPHGQPPNVTSISMACRNRAIRFPRRARVQIGHRFSQKSASNLVRWVFSLFMSRYRFPSPCPTAESSCTPRAWCSRLEPGGSRSQRVAGRQALL